MLKRPSSRRNSGKEPVEINLIPILDAMVTLIGFLLFTTSFLVIVNIESQISQAAPQDVQEQLKEKPLQLTVTLRDTDVEIWSPFSKISPKAVPNSANGQPNTKAIHDALVEIKKQFPTETTVVVAPKASTVYDDLIFLMDALRTLEPTDPPIYVKNEKTGIDEPLKTLFPKIVFGNLLGDS